MWPTKTLVISPCYYPAVTDEHRTHKRIWTDLTLPQFRQAQALAHEPFVIDDKYLLPHIPAAIVV